MLEKIVSGGQTGVDRAALDTAIQHNLPIGGWCPKGRSAEDGVIDARYPLEETPSPVHAQRTAWNVRDSDATLVLVFTDPLGGTALTVEEAAQRKKPLLVQRLPSKYASNEVVEWLRQHRVRVLNIAGPREGEAPGVYAATRVFMDALLSARQ